VAVRLKNSPRVSTDDLQRQRGDPKPQLLGFKYFQGELPMFDVKSPTLSSGEVVRHLQETLLNAVLLSQRLPGGKRQIVFPDLPFILRQPTVVLLEENLAKGISIEDLQKPIRMLSREALVQEARIQGDITYLRFQPVQREGRVVQLTLEAKIAPRDPVQHTLGLSGIQVKFQEVAGQWEVVDEPVFFAT
jgi:hypothetical protein